MVGRAQVVADLLGDSAQHLVAGSVTVRVVDGLEVVDVDEGDGQRSLVPVRPFDFVEECRQQRRAVRDAREAVDGRLGVGIGEGLADRIDRAREAGFEAGAVDRDAQRVVALGDRLRGLHEGREPIAEIAPQREGRQRDSDHRRHDRADDEPHAPVEFGIGRRGHDDHQSHGDGTSADAEERQETHHENEAIGRAPRGAGGIGTNGPRPKSCRRPTR